MAASQPSVWLSIGEKASCFKQNGGVRVTQQLIWSVRGPLLGLHQCHLRLRVRHDWLKSCMFNDLSSSFKRLSAVDDTGVCSDNLQDFEKQLEELFSNIKAMIKLGRKDNAVQLLEANYQAVKEQIAEGNIDIEQAALLDVIALGYMAAGDFEMVESILEMMNNVINCIPNDKPLMDSILIHMGGLYANLGVLDKASDAYGRGLRILENTFGSQSPFLVMPLLGLAKVLKLSGRVTEAMETYQRSITILEKSRGPMSEDLVLPLSSIGNLFIDEGRAADAKTIFSRILSIYSQSFGESDGRAGMAMCSLAHANCAEGNIDEAIRLYTKGLEIIHDSKYMSIDDDVLEKMKVDLAELLHAAGREIEGRELLEECLLINERRKGGEDSSTVTHYLNLASSYSRSKNFVEAERLLRTSLQLLSKTLKPRHQAFATPMLHLAVVLYNLRRDEEAENLATEALSIRESTFSCDSLPVGEALDILVSIQTRLGKDDNKALENLKRILAIQEREFGVESEEVMETLKKMVFFLDRMGRRDEKPPFQRRISVLRNKFQYLVPS